MVINGVDRHFLILHKYVQTEWLHIHTDPKAGLFLTHFVPNHSDEGNMLFFFFSLGTNLDLPKPDY